MKYKKTVAAAAIGLLAVVGIVVGVAVSSSSGPAGSQSIGGGMTATCKPVWLTNDVNGSPVTYASYTAAEQAAEQVMSESPSSPAIGGPTGEVDTSFQVSLTAGNNVDVGDLTIVAYDSSGHELGSTPLSVDQTLTTGQTWDDNPVNVPLINNGTVGAASCHVLDP